MNRTGLEIHDAGGSGYRPLIDFGAWRVAVLRLRDDLRAERIDRVERHVETDEVFVLLSGRAVLLLGGVGPQPNVLEAHVLHGGKFYNVRQNAWHTCLLDSQAAVLLVENRDTGPSNTEFAILTEDQRRLLRETARVHLAD
jgi:ureidoglycolate hydrolase